MSRAEQNTKLDLERIIFIGRTFDEYLDMFSLSVETLKGKEILDCPAGACSFTAVSNNLGLDVGKGCSVEEVKVPYEFQTNANSMLVIKK